MASPEEHHPLGPSTLKYVEICPGYRSSNESNVFAEEGTMLHSAAEHANFDGLNDEQAGCVRTCLDFLEPMESEADAVYKELKVPVHYGTGSIFGTVDRVVIRGDRGDVTDFKFGRGQIDDASVNIQGQAYLLGVMDKFPELKTVGLHFIIPRRGEVLSHDYTREDVEGIRLRISMIVDSAHSEAPDLRPNTEGCKYCKFRLSCPALRDKMLPLVKQYEPTVADFELQLRSSCDPATIEDPVTLSKMLNVAAVLDSWSKAARAQALKMAEEEGEEIPGYDLRWRAATAKFESAQDVYEALSDLFEPEEFMDTCGVSLSKLAKAYALKLPRGEKKGARGKLEMLLEAADLLPPEESRDRTPYLKKLDKDFNADV